MIAEHFVDCFKEIKGLSCVAWNWFVVFENGIQNGGDQVWRF